VPRLPDRVRHAPTVWFWTNPRGLQTPVMNIEPGAVWEMEFGDFPGGVQTAMVCAFPDAVDGGMDLCLPVLCETHHRSVWWCLNAHLLWCDGGPPEYEYHTWPT